MCFGDLASHHRVPQEALARRRRETGQTVPLRLCESKLERKAVETYRAINIYKLSQLRCLVVVLLRKELSKGCLSRIR